MRCKNLYMTKPHITLNLMADAVKHRVSNISSMSMNAMEENWMSGNPESHYDFYLENKKKKDRGRERAKNKQIIKDRNNGRNEINAADKMS